MCAGSATYSASLRSMQALPAAWRWCSGRRRGGRRSNEIKPMATRHGSRSHDRQPGCALAVHVRSVRTGRRAMCVRCVRPSRVCVCDALPNPRLQPSVPILVLQHKSEAARKLGSGSLLGLSIDAARVQDWSG